MNPEFWRGKRVLITGHTGFKGAWLALWLQQAGADVIGFSLPPDNDRGVFSGADVASGMTSIEGDIRDVARLRAALARHTPEVVFHLAAQALVRKSYADPVETFATNVMGTVNLLDAVREVPQVKVVVIVTSDKCYDNREWVWGYREMDRLGGHDPYSSSKACAELVTSAYRKSFFTPPNGAPVSIASARAGNVIGGGDWSKDRIIPDLVRAISNGEPATVRNPHAIRPWQHVLDCLNGYLILAEKLSSGSLAFADAWNFGPDHTSAKPVSWVADRVTKAWGNADWVSVAEPNAAHEAGCLSLDSAKARSALGWVPKLSTQQAIDWTVEWYKEDAMGCADRRSLTISQINRFQALGA